MIDPLNILKLKTRYKDFQSISDLTREISKTKNVLDCISGSMIFLEHLSLMEKEGKVQLDAISKGSSTAFHINKREEIDHVYEMGYIALFASFEAFMIDFTKELFIKHPESLPKEISLTIDEIKKLVNKEEIMEFMTDKAAMQKTYILEKWVIFLKKTYDINIFSSEKEQEEFSLLKEIRNNLVHSGGKVSSKFMILLSKKFNLSNLGINWKFIKEKEAETFYNLLMKGLEKILNNLKEM